MFYDIAIIVTKLFFLEALFYLTQVGDIIHFRRILLTMIRLTEFWAVLFHYHRNERIAMMKMPKKMQPSCFMASLGSVSLINSGKTETRAAKTIVWKKICFFTIKIWPYLYLEIPLQKKEESRKFWLLKTALSPRTRLRWPRAFPHLLSTFGLCQPPTWDRV